MHNIYTVMSLINYSNTLLWLITVFQAFEHPRLSKHIQCSTSIAHLFLEKPHSTGSAREALNCSLGSLLFTSFTVKVHSISRLTGTCWSWEASTHWKILIITVCDFPFRSSFQQAFCLPVIDLIIQTIPLIVRTPPPFTQKINVFHIICLNN